MDLKTQPSQIPEALLELAQGAGFLEPAITRKPKDDRIGYREEFGVERPKTTNLFEKMRGPPG